MDYAENLPAVFEGVPLKFPNLFLVRHRAGIALATTLCPVLGLATGVGVLATSLLLAAGHVLIARFATVLLVATCFSGLIAILRVKSQSGC
jgi:hypothetical protein